MLNFLNLCADLVLSDLYNLVIDYDEIAVYARCDSGNTNRLAEVGERVIYKSLHKRKPPLSFVYSFKFLPEAPHGFGHFFFLIFLLKSYIIKTPGLE